MNIIFTGYRCTGKTSTGRRLAALLGREFYDADDLIVARTGRTVEQIVAAGGWPAFREIEREVIAKLSQKDGCVIAPGGGAILDERNVTNLKKNGLFIWLVADSITIAERLLRDQRGGAPRPSLSGKPVEKEVQEVLAQREPIYRRIADLTVVTANLTVEEVAQAVFRKVARRRRPVPVSALAELIADASARTAEEIAALIVRRLGRDQAGEVAAAIRLGLGNQPERLLREEG